jgi:hypothetical protein
MKYFIHAKDAGFIVPRRTGGKILYLAGRWQIGVRNKGPPGEVVRAVFPSRAGKKAPP